MSGQSLPSSPLAAVYEIADQWFCELKVDLGRRHRVEVVGGPPEVGRESHAALADLAEPVTPAQFDEAVERGRTQALQEFPVQGEVDGVRVVGYADYVRLRGKNVRFVLEFKFSGSRNLYPSHVVQVLAYTHLLGQMGCSTNDAWCAVALLPPVLDRGAGKQLSLQALQAAGTLEAIEAATENLIRATRRGGWRFVVSFPPDVYPAEVAGPGPGRHEAERFHLFAWPYDHDEATRLLRSAARFWKREREALRTRFASKCRLCEFNACGLCPTPSGDASPSMRASKIERGGSVTWRVRKSR